MNIHKLNSGWLPISDISRKLGITERTAFRWLKAGKLESTMSLDGALYRVVTRQLSGQSESLDAISKQVADLLARLQKLEGEHAELLIRSAAIESVNADLTARLASIEHAHDMHVKVGALLVKRSKRLARLR